MVRARPKAGACAPALLTQGRGSWNYFCNNKAIQKYSEETAAENPGCSEDMLSGEGYHRHG